MGKLINFQWSKDAFRNFFAMFVVSAMLYMVYAKPEMRETLFVMIMLVIKFYFDTGASSSKKDDTINSMAKSIPDAPNNENKDVPKN